MTQECGIVLAHGRRQGEHTPSYLKEVLFVPQLNWAACHMLEAGLDCICAADSIHQKEAQAALPEGLSAAGAVSEIETFLSAHIDGEVFVALGDMPFVGADIIMSALATHKASGQMITLLAAASGHEGFWGGWFDGKALCARMLEANKRQDAVAAVWTALAALLQEAGHHIDVAIVGEEALMKGDNGRALVQMNETARRRAIDQALDAGVDIPFPEGVIIGRDVKIAPDAQILPGSILQGQTEVGKNTVIGPQTYVANCRIGAGCHLFYSHFDNAVVDDDVRVGPYSRLRPGSHVQSGVRIGNFVEIKNSNLGHNTKVAHLTYVGDADVGSGVNFGCGVVTVNYDGAGKYRTVIGDNAFVGCNANLVAPVRLGEGSYTAAGSTVTVDIPKDAVVIARCREVIKEGRAKALREKQRQNAGK